MLVRPAPGNLLSQPTPPRRRALSTSATLASAQKNPPPSPSPIGPPPSRNREPKPVPTPAVSNLYAAENTLLRMPSAKRKLFRLRRPSSTHGEPTRAARREREGVFNLSAVAAFISPPTSPVLPPRPPRNPARVHAHVPSSSGAGVPSSTVSRLHTCTDTRQLKAEGDAAADWEFPLPRGSEFPLQRKKSKSSRVNSSRIMQDASAKSNVPFSTLDRTILEELRQKIRAKEDQFVIRSGKKYHAFPSDEVPYPRSFDRQMVDLDVWDDLWQLQLGESITMHVFDTPPARVLDLGCGTGTWILNAAREWNESYFVGLDVVPLHPDLLQVGRFDLASRITWIQANFLERLPFPNEEFDYVRVVRVARGVPEDKWDGLLEEITRVMKPGGAFEMWEENLHFPGGRRGSVAIFESPDPRPPTPPRTDSSHSHSSEQERPLPSRATFAHLAHQSLPYSYCYSLDDVSRSKRPLFEETRRPLHAIPANNNTLSTPILLRNLDRPPMNPHDHSLLEAIYVEMHAARFINLEPVSLLANMLPLHFRDLRAPPPIVVTFPPPPVPAASDEKQNSPRSSPSRDERGFPVHSDTESDSSSQKGSLMSPRPSVLHGRDMAAGTPFVTLDTSRCSGFSPTALRRATVSLHPHDSPAQGPHRPAHSAPLTSRDPVPLSSISISSRQLAAGKNLLPNKTVNFDPRSLNLLLTLRVNEVLGCAEPMWDWVVDFQESVAQASSKMMVGSPRQCEQRTLVSPPGHRRHAKQDALMSLARQDFDALMRRFELDMKTRMYLGAAVEDRLGWASYPASSSEERENYEAMCTAWAEYEHRGGTGASVRTRDLSSPCKRRSSPLPLFPRRTDPEGDADGDGTVRGRDAPPIRRVHSHQHEPLDEERNKQLLRRKSAPGQAVRTRTIEEGAASAVPSRPSDAGPNQTSNSPLCSRTGRIFVAWKA